MGAAQRAAGGQERVPHQAACQRLAVGQGWAAAPAVAARQQLATAGREAAALDSRRSSRPLWGPVPRPQRSSSRRLARSGVPSAVAYCSPRPGRQPSAARAALCCSGSGLFRNARSRARAPDAARAAGDCSAKIQAIYSGILVNSARAYGNLSYRAYHVLWYACHWSLTTSAKCPVLLAVVRKPDASGLRLDHVHRLPCLGC